MPHSGGTRRGRWVYEACDECIKSGIEGIRKRLLTHACQLALVGYRQERLGEPKEAEVFYARARFYDLVQDVGSIEEGFITILPSSTDAHEASEDGSQGPPKGRQGPG